MKYAYIFLAGMAVAFLIVIVSDRTQAQLTPLQEVHEGYNHITIEEDGSYQGKTVDGIYENGCIVGGLCED